MTALAFRKTNSRKNIPEKIIPRLYGLESTKQEPYYDKEAEELRAAIARLRVDPQARLEHEAMLKNLTPLPHSLESMEGIPYYDEEFDMPQSLAHTNTVHLVIELIDHVAKMRGLKRLSDNPVSYLDSKGNRKILYPDYALTTNKDVSGIMAKELLFTLEVVSTERIDKEKKDSVRMLEYNAWNCVPEFVLIYPEPNDKRSVIWNQYHVETKSYREVTLPEDRRYRSETIHGLEIEVLDPSEWNKERKVRVYYQGEEVLAAEQERLARKSAERLAEQERFAREAAERQLEQLIARLKLAGIAV